MKKCKRFLTPKYSASIIFVTISRRKFMIFSAMLLFFIIAVSAIIFFMLAVEKEGNISFKNDDVEEGIVKLNGEMGRIALDKNGANLVKRGVTNVTFKIMIEKDKMWVTLFPISKIERKVI